MTAQRWLPWRLPPQRPALSQKQVHVWAASLEPSEPELVSLYSALSADERARATRYRSVRDRLRFVAARGLLRFILGRYLGVEAVQVPLRYDPRGKPELDAQGLAQPLQILAASLQFSVSHCENLALYAFALGRRVGVDIERIRPGFAEGTMAEQFFSPAEKTALRALPLHEQQAAFFACWTRKEAFLKALGEGLTTPMDSFTVSLAPGEPAALLEAQSDPRETERWSMRDLPVAVGYAASLVVEGHSWKLHCWRLIRSMDEPLNDLFRAAEKGMIGQCTQNWDRSDE